MKIAKVDGIIFTTDNKMIGFGRSYGPYIIANALRNTGLKIQVIEFFEYLTENDLRAIAEKYVGDNTLFIGFSSTHFSLMNSYLDIISGKPSDYFPRSNDFMSEFFKIFEEKNNNIKYIYGGVNIENTLRKHSKIDYWVFDEAEKVVNILVNYQIKRDMKIFDNIIDCSDNLPENFHTVPMMWEDSDLLFPDEHIPLEIERGCPYNCIFCKYRKIRYEHNVKRIDVLRDEVTRNYELYGIKNYMLTDSTFNSNIKKTDLVCNLFVSLPFDIKFVSFARLDGFIKYPETREMLLEAGAEGLSFGIESLNPKTLEAIKKGPHPDIQMYMFDYLKEKWKDKIHISCCFIAGLPYDNEDDIRKWFDYAKFDSPIDVVNIKPLYIPKSMAFKRKSPLTLNPGKWGYKFLDGCNWISETSNMTFEKAIDLCDEIYKHRLVGHSYYNRLRNIGFSKDETWSMEHILFADEIEARKLQLKDKYIQRLLK